MRLHNTHLVSDSRQKGIKAGGQKHTTSKRVAEGNCPPVAHSLVQVRLHHSHRDENSPQHQDKHAQKAQDFSYNHLHVSDSISRFIRKTAAWLNQKQPPLSPSDSNTIPD